MLQNIHYQYKNACMMLFRREGEEVSFRGTAFLVHPDGYFLTAAHLIDANYEHMVVPLEDSPGFASVHARTVTPIRVEVRQMDPTRDVALLRFTEEIDVSMPDHVMGLPEEVPVGNSVACIGFPFGYYGIYNQMIRQAAICSKIASRTETGIFLFDTMVHDGDRGGPLINLHDGRIVGVVGARFKPQDLMPEHLKSEEAPIRTEISYAVSVGHAMELMEKEDLSVI